MHAILSPSSASRWLACTPSARLEHEMPYTTSDAAEEGTLAHSLSELILKLFLKNISKKQYGVELKNIQANKFYNGAMLDYCNSYTTYVIEQFSEVKKSCKDAVMFLEKKLNLSDYVPEGFGTVDVVIIANGAMQIIDLKYGKGVPVSAEENKQMMLYALGALKDYDYAYGVERILMTIVQPRLDDISNYEVDVAFLLDWANNELIPKAKLAFTGEGEFIAGKHCQFCKIKATCRANAELHLELAKYDFMDNNLLTDHEIADILDRSAAFKKWLTAVEENALLQAVTNGKKWPGYKLVEGRSNRIYADENKVIQALTTEYDDAKIFNKKLKGITEMEKGLGKNEFKRLVEPLLIKPPGSPVLVPESDKRTELNSMVDTIAAFEHIETD